MTIQILEQILLKPEYQPIDKHINKKILQSIEKRIGPCLNRRELEESLRYWLPTFGFQYDMDSMQWDHAKNIKPKKYGSFRVIPVYKHCQDTVSKEIFIKKKEFLSCYERTVMMIGFRIVDKNGAIAEGTDPWYNEYATAQMVAMAL